MAGKRQWLARVLDSAGVWELILRARGAVGARVLTAVTYHRIQDPERAGSFDAGVIDATPGQFAEQVSLLARYFNLIGVAELLDYFDGGELPPNPAMITFDDGYRECLDVAVPILERYRAPATFFVATRYVGERRLFWWDLVGYVVARSRLPRIVIEYPRPTAVELGDRRAAARSLSALVKTHYGLDLDRFCRELVAASGVDLSADRERALADELIMTWDDVRALRDAGMDVGSHTHAHRVLQTLSREQQLDELVRSREILERELGSEVRAIAYPVGRSIASDPQLRGAVSRAGYRLGFSSKTGANALWRDVDPLDIKRLSFDCDSPPSLIRGMLAVPQLAY